MCLDDDLKQQHLYIELDRNNSVHHQIWSIPEDDQMFEEHCAKKYRFKMNDCSQRLNGVPNHHELHKILPDKQITKYNLRVRKHNFLQTAYRQQITETL